MKTTAKPLRCGLKMMGLELISFGTTVLNKPVEFSAEFLFCHLHVHVHPDMKHGPLGDSFCLLYYFPIRNWKPALNRFIIEFEDRLTDYI